MSRSSTILERLRWKVGLGLVVLAAAGAAALPASLSDHSSSVTARSSWGEMDMARSSWGDVELMANATASDSDVRSSWG